MTEIAVGLGIVISLFLTETLGVMAGGVIVPGYIALYLHDPLRIIGTFIASLLAFGIVQILSRFIFIYGKRRLVLSLLLGFLLGYLSKIYLGQEEASLAVIGNIIPGLIASWMDRQGVVRTISVILMTAGTVQLLLILISGGKIHV
jgi:gamma-polyglutamate biosynthesis protein CapC